MPKIRLLPIDDKDKKTPGFSSVHITYAKKNRTIIDTVGEEVRDGIPCWNLKIPGYGDYVWYVHKAEAQVVGKPTIIIGA